MATYISTIVWVLKLKIQNFSNGDIFVQNHWTMTKFKLELLIPKMYLDLYVKFELNVYNHWGDNELKLKISDFFSKFKRDNSVSYHQTMTKLEIDQCILMT
jgi:hypothetical protein